MVGSSAAARPAARGYYRASRGRGGRWEGQHVLCLKNHHSGNTPSYLERPEALSHISLDGGIKESVVTLPLQGLPLSWHPIGSEEDQGGTDFQEIPFLAGVQAPLTYL